MRVSSYLHADARFLWCIVLSLIYADNVVYDVKGSFLHRFGRLPVWWLAVTSAVVSAILYDIAIITLRVSFIPKDADVFAELEKDPLIKSRFEEEAASELQQSWNRGKNSRDDEIQALLDQPRLMEEGKASMKAPAVSAKPRTSDDDDDDKERSEQCDRDLCRIEQRERLTSLTHTGFDEELARRFGAVIRKPFKRPLTSESG